ncbi:MAG: hypothetical protein IPK81_03210 [Rhodospirillales bacterium]|nr:MAG: hypothetical protein IPK81_03210 [Rhodospirillales bacterium]
MRNTMLLNRAEAVAARAAAGRTGGRGPDTATAPPGVSVALTPKRLERDELIAFFQAEEAVYGPHASFHNDRDFAMRSGLPDIIAPGRYVIGLVNGMMFRLHGAAWLRGALFRVDPQQHPSGPGCDRPHGPARHRRLRLADIRDLVRRCALGQGAGVGNADARRGDVRRVVTRDGSWYPCDRRQGRRRPR